MNRAAKVRVFVANMSSYDKGVTGEARNKVAVRNLIIKMFVYSAMKMKANVPLPNSILKPETSSDSPSAKSKGVRLVSARVEMNHITIRGIKSVIKGREVVEVR